MFPRLQTLFPFTGLLSSVSLMMLGSGFLGTVVGLHAAEIGFSNFEAGVLSAALYIGILLATVTIHFIFGLAGHIRSFAALASIFSAATLSHPFFTDFYFFCLLRFIEGFTICGLYVCVESWLNEQSDSANRGLVMSAYTFIFYLSFGFAQYILLLDLGSWFYRYAIASIVISLALVPVSLTTTPQPPPPSPERLSLITLIKLTPMSAVVCLLFGIVWAASINLIPFLAPQMSLGTEEVAYVISAVTFGIVAIQPPMGLIADKINRRLILAALSIAVTVVSFAIMLVGTSSITVFIILVFFFGAFVGTLYPMAIANASDHVDHQMIVSAIGALILVTSIGSISGPIIATQFIGEDPTKGLFGFITVVMGICSVFCLLRWRLTSRADIETQSSYQLMPSALPGLSEYAPSVIDDQYSFDFDGDGFGDGGPIFPVESEPEAPAKS